MAVMTCPVAGNVFEINVKVGDTVKAGDEVIVLESMKMEIPLNIEGDGTITEICVTKGQAVDLNAPLLKY